METTNLEVYLQTQLINLISERLHNDTKKN